MAKIGSDDISKMYLGNEEVLACYLGSDLIYELNEGTTPYIKSDGKTLVIPKGAASYGDNTTTTRTVITNLVSDSSGSDYSYTSGVVTQASQAPTVTSMGDIGAITFNDQSYEYGSSNTDTHNLWVNNVIPNFLRGTSYTIPSGTSIYLHPTDDRNYYYCIEMDFSDSGADYLSMYNNYIWQINTRSSAGYIGKVDFVITTSFVTPSTSSPIWYYVNLHPTAYGGTAWSVVNSNKANLSSNKKAYLWVLVSGSTNSSYPLRYVGAASIGKYKESYGEYLPYGISGTSYVSVGYSEYADVSKPYVFEMAVQSDGSATIRS